MMRFTGAVLVLSADASLTYDQYLQDFNKTIPVGEDYTRLQELFLKNQAMIHAHNAAGGSFKMAVNQFADVEHIGSSQTNERNTDVDFVHVKWTPDIPEELDWRTDSNAPAVKDMGMCNAGWAFAATSSLESVLPYVFSPQSLLDCRGVACSDLCLTGGLLDAVKTITEFGVQLEKDAPYKSHHGQNFFNQCAPTQNFRTAFAPVVPNDSRTLMHTLFTDGPVVVSIARDAMWWFYNSGIYDKCTSRSVNHAMLLVGYGKEDSKGYWTLQNSFGDKWGEGGYMRLLRSLKKEGCEVDTTCGRNRLTCGECGILVDSVVATGPVFLHV